MKSIALTLALLGVFAVAANAADNTVTVTTDENINKVEVDLSPEEANNPEEPAKK